MTVVNLNAAVNSSHLKGLLATSIEYARLRRNTDCINSDKYFKVNVLARCINNGATTLLM